VSESYVEDKMSNIWWDRSWNPVSGCTPVGPECDNCYARAMIERFKGCKGWPESPDTVTLWPERLDQPRHWRKSHRVFVCSMGDLFHQDVPDEFIERAFSVMEDCPQHTFMVLTKRAERMYDFWWHRVFGAHIWAGITGGTQETLTQRIHYLSGTLAPNVFISVGPMLGPISLSKACTDSDEYFTLEKFVLGSTAMGNLDIWGGTPGSVTVLCEGESGPNARPMHVDWVRALRDECVEHGVRFYFKQWGEWLPESHLVYVPWHVFEGTGAGITEDGQHVVFPKYRIHKWGDGTVSWRVGRKNAGRSLDGRGWNYDIS
jgi:protein gp37